MTNARINRKLTLDSYKNDCQQMACQKKECAKISSICNELIVPEETTMKISKT
jgi:hypothetical protein